MKKSVYITGICCAILMLFGCIFKIMHWPGANMMIIVSVFLFCLWFLPAALINNYNLLPLKKMKTLHVVTYFVFAICMMSVLFKIMHWPGASVLLFPGLLAPFVIFLPVYLYHTRDEEKTGNKNLFALILGLTFLAVFSVFLIMGISKNVLLQAAQFTKRNEANTASYTSVSNSNGEISRKANDLVNYTEELKCLLLTAAGENMCSDNKLGGASNISDIADMGNLESVRRTFSLEDGLVRAKTLKEKINAFRTVILSKQEINPELAELTKSLFDTNDEDINGIYAPGIAWEQREFNSYPLIFTLDFLSRLQSNVRLVEREAIN